MLNFKFTLSTKYSVNLRKQLSEWFKRSDYKNEFRIVWWNDVPHELLLTTRQRAKLSKAFNNNKSSDLNVSKANIAKII